MLLYIIKQIVYNLIIQLFIIVVLRVDSDVHLIFQFTCIFNLVSIICILLWGLFSRSQINYFDSIRCCIQLCNYNTVSSNIIAVTFFIFKILSFMGIIEYDIIFSIVIEYFVISHLVFFVLFVYIIVRDWYFFNPPEEEPASMSWVEYNLIYFLLVYTIECLIVILFFISLVINFTILFLFYNYHYLLIDRFIEWSICLFADWLTYLFIREPEHTYKILGTICLFLAIFHEHSTYNLSAMLMRIDIELIILFLIMTTFSLSFLILLIF